MFSLRNALIAAVAVAAGMFGAANAPAAKVIEIKDPSSGKDSGWRAMVEDGIDLTVFSVANDLTTLSLEKFAHFSNGPTQDGYIEPLRITFFQVSSEATSQIKIADEVVINDTGVDWTGFSFKLESAGFGPNGGPTFDTALTDGFNIDPFTTRQYSNGDTQMVVGGGIVPHDAGSGLDDVWTPGLISGDLVINADPFSSGNIRQMFVFKEQPLIATAVPLPAAAWSAMSLMGVLVLPKALRKGRELLA